MLDSELVNKINIFNDYADRDEFLQSGHYPVAQENLLRILCDYGEEQCKDLSALLNERNITFLVKKANILLEAKYTGEKISFYGSDEVQVDDMSYLTDKYMTLMSKWLSLGVVEECRSGDYKQFILVEGR